MYLTFDTEVLQEYKMINIHNRRYLGSKYKLLAFIKNVVDENCLAIKTVFDMFSGTGSVSSIFLDKIVITNDNMYSNYICHIAFFIPLEYSIEKIKIYITKYNNLKVYEDNYFSDTFANTFFSEDNCKKIGYIREDIENSYNSEDINFKEKAILITSLLYACDKIANTCGHYDAYRKGIDLNKNLILYVPFISDKLNANNSCYNLDANILVKQISADLVYLDPPYNSRHYCDTYHVLENLARWEKPEVVGVAKKMNRTDLKSKYSTLEATSAFEDLVVNIKAKYILLSYNSMANNGNGRSNAKISDDDIMRILSKKGEVSVFSKPHKLFTAGKSNHNKNEERLFLCKCFL